jgi:uncharacterized protein DUF5329
VIFMQRIGLTLLLWFVLVPTGQADDAMNEEIDYILNAVATSNCIFIRNGKEHGAEAAKDHLSLKRNRGKRYFSSADEFIENLASSSSWTGKPYYIRCGEEEHLAKDWFTAVLQEYRDSQ